MPPRRRPVQELEIEELRRQIQQLQVIVNAQQKQLKGQRMPQGNNSDSSSSSSTYDSRPQRQVYRNDDIRVEIPDVDGKLQPDEFIDRLQTVEKIFEYKGIPEEDKGPIFDEEPAYDEEITPADQGEIYDASEDDEGPIFDQEPVYDEEFTPADQGESLVIPIDACHLLLGRPWPYDRRTMYNGHSNTYSCNMTPLSPSELDKGKQEPKPLVSLISRAQFKVTAEEAQTAIFILFCEANEETVPPPETKEILAEFLDVVPEIPPRLPPKRDNQHAIDFIPGAVIPNKPAYRMKVHDEIQRQELLKKGFLLLLMLLTYINNAELDSRTSLVQPGEDVMENNELIPLPMLPPTTSHASTYYLHQHTLNGVDLIGLD